MKKVLITGANSYIGTSFEKWMAKMHPGKFEIDTLDMQDDAWKRKDFSKYDVVFHVAGIVHIKEKKRNRYLYYKVNRDMAIKVAKKAKAAGVSQFIFMSTMNVYGMETGVITKSTPTHPKNSYADSKLQAERGIKNLEEDSFKVCILRPPMIYGKNCKGNFQKVIELTRMLPVFPQVENKRSLIFVDNLCAFIKKSIDLELCGVYFPQNREYMNTTKMASWIAQSIEKKFLTSCLLGVGVKMLQPFVGAARKGFGTLIYEGTEDFDFDYCIYDSKASVRKSV